jgi:hypothetical protein
LDAFEGGSLIQSIMMLRLVDIAPDVIQETRCPETDTGQPCAPDDRESQR